MSTLTSKAEVSGVTLIERPGVGPIYRGIITIGELYENLRDSTLRYAPKYQRGFRDEVIPMGDYELLLPIWDEKLALEWNRARSMATKFLMALNGVGTKRLYSSYVIWNARREKARPAPKYDPGTQTLEIGSVITIPDTGHRHLSYYLLGRWKSNPEEIPDEFTLEPDEDMVNGDQIREWLASFNPYDGKTSSVYVDIYNLTEEEEGWLFDEFNSDADPPSGSASIDFNPNKTPSRRFVYRLITHSPIFARSEVEFRRNTIGSKSRKLTTNFTLEAAIRPFKKRLMELEKTPALYQDLVDFFSEFFQEWSLLVPEFHPNSTAEKRHGLRKQSFALSNIMFFPLFRLAFELWDEYREKRAKGENVNWPTDNHWKNILARLAGQVEVEIGDEKKPGQKKKMKMDVMSRDNPEWQGRILVKKFDSQGNPTGWSLSSTRQTREAAYHYLCQIAGVTPPAKPQKKNNKKTKAA